MTKPSWIRWNYRTTNAFTKQTNGTPTIQYSICMVWYNYKSCSVVLLSKAIPKLPTKKSMVGRWSFFSWGLLKAYFQKGLMLVTRGTWLRRSGSSPLRPLRPFFQVRWRCKAWQRPLKRPWRTVTSRQRWRRVSLCAVLHGRGADIRTESLRVYLGFGSSHHIWYLID